MDLYQTPARALDKFVQDQLKPHKAFLDQVSQAVNTICRVLREKCFQSSTARVRVLKVIKGGSYGRGTALRGGCDADLVVFLSCFKAYADQRAWPPENFAEIRAQLEACWQNQPQTLSLQFCPQEDPGALRFQLISATLHSWMDVSLRPAFNALGQLSSDSKPSPQIYADLISSRSPAGTFATCFTELRRDFVNVRPCKLKHLILLVKHWYLLVTEAPQGKLQSKRASLPPVYALELLTIYAWEKGCSKEKFNIAEGFRTVLGLVQSYQKLCVYWEVNYSFKDEIIGPFLRSQLKKPRPLILDPADPTWDVGRSQGQCWDLLAQEAGSCLSCPCFVQGDGSQVRPWDVLVNMDLYQTPAKDLDKFIQDVLRPDTGFQEQLGKVTDTIFKCLREKCFRSSSPAIRVLRVSKGGSYGRGTALRGGCDADLIVFLSCFKTYADQRAWPPENFAEIRAQLEACWQNQSQTLSLQFCPQEDPGALRFQLVSATPPGQVDISLQPTFDALGTYSQCFTELQRNFVNSCPSKLKSLILLVKHWYQQCLPPVYALELLTIYAWEQAGRKNKFHVAEGFRTVLDLIREYQQLCIYWTVNYDFSDKTIRSCLQKQLQKPRPLILDPADPTWNVGQGNWERLAREAETCGSQSCFVNGDGSSVQPWDVMPALLQQTPSWDLDCFISKFLQPNREFLGQVNRAVDIICSFLKENCFRNSSTKVLKVVKGGSSAKGTALRGRSDADLVVFLSCFRGYSDHGTNRAELIAEIRAQLEACQRQKQFEVKFEISKWENPRVLSFTLFSKSLDHSVDFDVLPAFDALGQLGSGTKPKPQVYIDLIDSYNNGGEFSTCFTERQRDFVVSRPTKLKSLIRLVKHWYKQCMRIPKGRGALPPQYALELLTIYAWEQGNGTAQFDMAEGFRTVLELVQNYKNLCIHWKVNYDSENEIIKNFLTQQLRKPRPIILDPADPTGNLGPGTRWDLLAKEAASYANSVCCANKFGDFVQPWVLKGGSYGRDTVLKGRSDGTLVIFLNEQFEDDIAQKRKIRQVLEMWDPRPIEKVEMIGDKLQLVLVTSELHITFEVLPVFSTWVKPSNWNSRTWASSYKPSPEVYRNLIKPENSACESSVCFTELQGNFFNTRPQKLKNLILLVKFWYQQCQRRLGQDSFPLQYALELLTVYAWEQGSDEEEFNTGEGILTVLELITQYDKLCIYWTVNYNFEDETIRNYLQNQLRKVRPIILDPADPTHNVSGSDPEPWKQLAKEVKDWSFFSSFMVDNMSSLLPWDVLPASLYATRGHWLDTFIKDFLQPDKTFLDQTGVAVDIICSFLKEECFRNSLTKVEKVVKGGSSAKGTALKRGSDADLVVFLSCFKNYSDQNTNRLAIIKEIQKQLEACQQKKQFEVELEISKWENPRVLSFTLKSKRLNQSQEFDLLPAFNVLGEAFLGNKSKPNPEDYIKLIKLYESSYSSKGGEFSTCFTELQRDFIISRPTKLKSLIRLMKHWYKQCHKKLKKKVSFPPKYALELLTVYAWEQGSGMEDFDTAEGFRTVLELIMQYQQICIYWIVNYNFQNEIIRHFLSTQLRKSRPVILDPADPTGDVGGGNRWAWHLLAQEAEIWSSSLCFKKGNFEPVKPWPVPTVQTPGSSGLGLYPMANPTFSSERRMFFIP
ncbi:2'-5'-oligoadenylate synthase 3-like [Gracilinanus agilis]|uniref:2'-5'-oligoadenylate synthase 3-like n=1 Tax=Gracilinanus agilis TaxID=191870 RepID=UPI001CFE87A7|nr:2'-5'-oligoadenylate synthase 3-like [Gracilinanus agilis]